MEENNKIYKKYLLHTFLYKFTESLSFVFGALLLYTKTQSLLSVLLFGLIVKLISLIFRTIGLPIYFKLLKSIGILQTMALGSVLVAIAYTGIFSIHPSSPLFYFLIYGFAIVQSIGNTLFVNISSTIKYNTVGSSNSPGKFTAGVQIANIGAQICSVFMAFYLNTQNHFLLSFIVGALFQLISILPLWNIQLPQIKPISFMKCLAKLSFPAILANINIEHELSVTALPLIIMLTFSSLEKSIFISTIVSIGTILLSYTIGSLKDKGNNKLSVISFIILLAVWISYAFAQDKSVFIALGIISGFFTMVIDISRDARLSREISNSRSPFEAVIGNEIARTFGMLLTFIFLLLVYSVTHTIPQIILILGVIFIIPKCLYAIGNLDKNNLLGIKLHQ